MLSLSRSTFLFQPWSNLSACNFLVILKNLIRWFRCFIRTGAKLCKKMDLEGYSWEPLLYILKLCDKILQITTLTVWVDIFWSAVLFLCRSKNSAIWYPCDWVILVLLRAVLQVLGFFFFFCNVRQKQTCDLMIWWPYPMMTYSSWLSSHYFSLTPFPQHLKCDVSSLLVPLSILYCGNTTDQSSSTPVLEGHCPAECISNSNQAYLWTSC